MTRPWNRPIRRGGQQGGRHGHRPVVRMRPLDQLAGDDRRRRRRRSPSTGRSRPAAGRRRCPSPAAWSPTLGSRLVRLRAVMKCEFWVWKMIGQDDQARRSPARSRCRRPEPGEPGPDVLPEGVDGGRGDGQGAPSVGLGRQRLVSGPFVGGRRSPGPVAVGCRPSGPLLEQASPVVISSTTSWLSTSDACDGGDHVARDAARRCGRRRRRRR